MKSWAMDVNSARWLYINCISAQIESGDECSFFLLNLMEEKKGSYIDF